MLIVLPALSELLIFLVLVIVGVILILLIKAAIQLIVPIVAAVIVWYLAHSLIYAGIAFLALAILQLILKRR